MKRILLLCLVLAFISCKEKPSETETPKSDISDISTKEFREFKVEDSKYIDVDQFWKPFEEDMKSFTEDDYMRLKPMFFDQDMPTIQKNIKYFI